MVDIGVRNEQSGDSPYAGRARLARGDSGDWTGGVRLKLIVALNAQRKAGVLKIRPCGVSTVGGVI
ncbi:MAG: hypothetical protein JXM68_04030 [Sedimentisphaerales bacterium]|nr:hypothetical protein [Sedimentisphaerales bacterium]